eukprot:6585432-Prymnesium_polylepis.1
MEVQLHTPPDAWLRAFPSRSRSAPARTYPCTSHTVPPSGPHSRVETPPGRPRYAAHVGCAH